MTLQTQKTQDVIDLIIAQLESALSQTIPLLPRAFNRVLSKALGGVYILLYKYCGFMFLQLFVETATNDETEINGKKIKPLEALGVMMGVGPPTAAVAAELEFTFYPILPTGASTLASGTPILCDANGVIYTTVGDVAYGGGGAPVSETVTIKASGDQQGGNGAGVVGNLDDDTVVSFVSPPANIDRDGIVSDTTVYGVDEEDLEVYKSRIFARFQTPPQGGAYADYSLWGETVAGIVNVYPYTGDPGQVNVYSEVSTDLDADGIPDAAKLAEVAAAIELDDASLASRRPANSYVNSLAITRTAHTVTVAGLTVDNETVAEAAITDAIEDWYLSREPYIAGWSVGVRKDQIYEASVAGVVNDVVSSLGGLFTGVELAVGGVPFEITTLGEGEKVKATVSFS